MGPPRDSVFIKSIYPSNTLPLKFISEKLPKILPKFAFFIVFWAEMYVADKNQEYETKDFLSYLWPHISRPISAIVSFISHVNVGSSCDQWKSCSVMFKYLSWFKWTFFDVIPFSAIWPDFTAFVESGFYENKVATKEDERNIKFQIDWKTDQ